MSSSSSSAAACSSAGAVPASPGKICFNAHCKERVTERPTTRRRGWRLRSGELSELCDRCSVAYDQGNFCETFHLEEDGWRKCQSCGKRVHCGCVVSIAAFMLLDAGGIECMPCARKSFAMGTNSLWSSSIPFPLGPEKLKDLSAKSWNQIATTSSVPGQWRQASNMWNTSQSELQQRLSYEFDRPNGTDRLMPGTRLAIPSQDKKKVEDSDRAMPHMNHVQLGIITNGKSSFGSLPTFSEARREDGNADGLRDSSHPVGETDTIGSRKVAVLDPSSSTSAGINFKAIPVSTANVSLASAVKDEPSVPLIGLPSPFPATSDLNDSIRASSAQTRQLHVPPLSKQNYPGTHNAADAVVESQNQARNGKPRADGRCRSQLLPRYWPRITDQELQQINGDPNSVITPLFEKMLSASDAGRIGRLVLPKKCAEAYFPPISQPEGVPLKVQDARGQEWAFQFRFWPNNNSRMYVLEGVTPCIQSMKLQAGDIVTFSRIEPEGKLIMGFRKASNVANEQEGPTSKSGHGYPITKEASYRNGKPGDGTSGPSPRLPKGNSEQRHMIVSSSDQTSWSKVGRAGFIQKEGTASKPSTLPLKRKSNWLGAKSKRLRMENEDSIELKLTWEEAQELLRPPPDHKPSIVIIEGHEFEEYEEAPVLGKPTIFTTNEEGEKNQWARCEDCLKWRKLPANALLPPRWTCLDNSWDPEKSSCSSPQEISTQQLADLLHCNNVPSKKSKTKAGNEPVEASDGLDTLANLAIMGEGESSPCSSQPTTRHPRHRPGCTCIVCIQPPSGKGPKHKQTCQCNVCLTVKRRFRTLMLRKEKRQSEKEAEKAEAARKKHQEVHTTETPSQQDGDTLAAGNAVGCETQAVMASPGEGNVDGEPDRKKALPSPIKTQIDLNIQPEREEEPSPLSNAGNSMRLLRDAAA